MRDSDCESDKLVAMIELCFLRPMRDRNLRGNDCDELLLFGAAVVVLALLLLLMLAAVLPPNATNWLRFDRVIDDDSSATATAAAASSDACSARDRRV
jgi:ABC-type sulfate transport system permease component